MLSSDGRAPTDAAPRAVGEKGGAPFAEVQPPRIYFGQRRHERCRRDAFRAREPLHLGDEIAIGECGERPSLRHSHLYHRRFEAGQDAVLSVQRVRGCVDIEWRRLRARGRLHGELRVLRERRNAGKICSKLCQVLSRGFASKLGPDRARILCQVCSRLEFAAEGAVPGRCEQNAEP